MAEVSVPPPLTLGVGPVVHDPPDSTVEDHTPSTESSIPMDSDTIKSEMSQADFQESVAPIVIRTSPNGGPVVVSTTGNGQKSHGRIPIQPKKNFFQPSTQTEPRPLGSGGAMKQQQMDKEKKQPKEKPPAPITVLVRALTHPTTGMYPGGISPKQLLDYLNSVNPADMQTTKNQLQVQLCRQANRGHLVRMQTGCYTTPDLVDEIHASGKMPKLPKLAPKKPSPSLGNSAKQNNRKNASNASSESDSYLSKIGFKPVNENAAETADIGEDRPKRKRTKKQMGPEFLTGHDVVAKKAATFCDFCQQSGVKSQLGKQEAMLFCKDCSAKAHPTCMGYSDELAARCRRSPWQCIDCKTCVVCATSENADSLLFCDSCDKGYHMACHLPIISEKPPGKWVCSTCSLYGVNRDSKSGTQSPASEEVKKLTAKGKPKVSAISNKKPVTSWLRIQPGGIAPVCRCDANAVLPDLSWENSFREAANCAKTWTATEVHEFVKGLGFIAEANTFAEQEIDGQALLLLKRSDVLSRMSLKLGPALKLYRRILAVQSAYERTSNSTPAVTQLSEKL